MELALQREGGTSTDPLHTWRSVDTYHSISELSLHRQAEIMLLLSLLLRMLRKSLTLFLCLITQVVFRMVLPLYQMKEVRYIGSKMVISPRHYEFLSITRDKDSACNST